MPGFFFCKLHPHWSVTSARWQVFFFFFQHNLSYYNLMQKNTEPIPTAIRRSGLLSCFWLRENCRGQVKLWSPGRSMWVQGHMTDISTDLWSHSQSLKAAGFPAVWAAPSDAHQWWGCVCVPPTLGISCCQGDINKAGRGLSSALKLLLFPVDCWLFAASSLCTSWDEVTHVAWSPNAHFSSLPARFFSSEAFKTKKKNVR